MVNFRIRPLGTFIGLLGFAAVVNILVLLIPDLDLLKASVGFIWLFLLPGWLINRLIRLHTPSNWERIGFTVGFSVLAVMATGLLVNTILPHLGNSQPLTPGGLMLGFDVVW